MICPHGKLDGCAVCEEIARLERDRAAAIARAERAEAALQAARNWISDREYCEEWLTEDMFDSTQRHMLKGIDAALAAKETKETKDA